jgi:hypothetical protein
MAVEPSKKFYKLPAEIACRRDLTGGAKILLAVITDRIGNNTDCWPGFRTLAKDTGLSKPAVIAAVRQLETKRELQIERRGRGKVNHYHLVKSGQECLPPSMRQSGKESLPVDKVNRSRNFTTGGQETLPEVVKNVYPNQRDPLNQRCATRFVKPTLVELETYAQEINYDTFDPQVFLDHYESNGWMVGKSKMKAWKPTLRNWKRREPENCPADPMAKFTRPATEADLARLGL